MTNEIKWLLLVALILVLALLSWGAMGQDTPRHPEAQINRMVKEHQRDHYIDFDRAVCFIRIDDDGSWILHCEYRGEGAILKKFECMCIPCRDCPKKWKVKYRQCKKKLKRCLRPERKTKIRAPQKKTPAYEVDDDNDGHSASRRSPGKNGND